jgi:pimeloyl-ACP methyl ester carboxylesterase
VPEWLKGTGCKPVGYAYVGSNPTAPTVNCSIVLVHGAWGGSWVWERVVPLLEGRGFRTLAMDLPSVGADPDDGCSLATDAAAVARVLDREGGPFLVCGHSYGGMVITHATAGRSDVSRLVYLCAFMPDAGDSLFTITGGASPWIHVLADGRTLPDLERAARVGYIDCDAETRASAIARLRPQVPAPFLDPVPVAAWREIPATYIVCTEDQSLPAELQRAVFAPRAGEVVELVSGHAAFFSQPERVAELLAERAESPAATTVR